MQCQQQEAIAKQQIESSNALTNSLKKEESRLRLQESDYAERLTRSSEAMAALTREGGLFTTRMNEEVNDARSEVMAEKAVAVDQQVSREKVIKNINEKHKTQEDEANSSKHEAQEEIDKCKSAEATIERQN